MAAALALSLAFRGEAGAQMQPSVATDQADYSPGSIVSISGTGFQPGETVRLQVLRIDVDSNDGPEHLPWEVGADDSGAFEAAWLVTPHEAGATLRLTATGLASGLAAETTFTDSVIVPASGGEAIPADTFNGAYTTLTGPVISETVVADVGIGTIVLTAPAGFVFDTNAPLPYITLNGDNASKNINNLANGAIIPLAVTTNQVSFTVAVKSHGQARNTLTYSNIRVRPTAAFPLASGNLTNTGTSLFPNSTTNFGTLTEVAGSPTRLVVSGFPSPQTAGVAGTVTVKAEDQFGNPAAGYRGTIRLTSTDAQAALPADYTFVSGDNGTHTFSAGVTLKTAGTQSITVSDIAVGSFAGAQSGIIVNPAAAARLVFATQPGSAVYGSLLSPQPAVKSQDSFGNDSAAGLGASKLVSLSLSGGSGTLAGTTSLDIGTGAGSGTAVFTDLKVNAAGSGKQLTASASGLSSALSSSFTVTPAGLVVAADNATRAYGEPNPTFTASTWGFVNGEDNSVLGGNLALTTTAETTSPPGDYPIVPSGLVSTNYSITFSNGTLRVITTNQPPFLAWIADAVVRPDQWLILELHASDPNGDRLTFGLDSGAPASAVITNRVRSFPQPATNTVFRWRPTRAQASTTNQITVRVTDDGEASLSAPRTFTVVVLDYVEISIGSTNVQRGDSVAVPIRLASSDGVTNLEFRIQWPSNYLAYTGLEAAAPAVGSCLLQGDGTNVLVAMQAVPGQVLQGTQRVAQLSFMAISNEHSAFVPLPIGGASAVKPGGSLYTNYLTPGGLVAVVESEPLLRAFLSTDWARNLTLYGRLGFSYQLQYCTDLVLPNGWALQWSYVQTNGAITIGVDSVHPNIFYRIFQP